jgi:hypothetical protein
VAVKNDSAEGLLATERLINAVRSWYVDNAFQSHVTDSEILNPRDEFGSYSYIAFHPSRTSSCELEIRFIPSNPPQVDIVLDSWIRLAEGHNLQVAPLRSSAREFKCLFLEPRAMSVQELLGICDAVAGASIDLFAGIIGDHLIATGGGVRSGSRFIRMQSIDFPCFS